MPEIWGIILAAGESKRMKTRKLLLPFHGSTMIEKVIDNVISSEIKNILVVLGSGREEILEVIKSLPVKHCYNENFTDGMLSSVKRGFRYLPKSMDAVLIFLGDQPGIPGHVVKKLIRVYEESKKGILMPVFKQKRGHPVLIDCKYRNEIEKLDEKEGLRSLAIKFPDDVLEVEVDDDGILRDIDTREEYLKETSIPEET
jgi:CTP:molybdopterin cytidylyltransferase MocA